MQYLSGFLSGFIVETFASLDDTISRIPVMMGMTKTLKGKIMFAFGSFLAIFGALFAALFFADIVKGIDWFHYVTAGLIYTVAIVSYLGLFDRFQVKIRSITTNKTRWLRWAQLVIIGFLISFLALVDDTLLILPLFEHSFWSKFWVSAGVVISTLLQVILMVVFVKNLDALPYRREIASGGLIVYATLVLFQII